MSCFHVDATFEMRTVLYEIRLFNDKLEMHDRVFISNKLCRERARQWRDRKRECVGDSSLLEMRYSVGNKIDCWRKYL
jgi:hypothetical protein